MAPTFGGDDRRRLLLQGQADDLGRLGEDHVAAALEGRAHQLIAGAGQSAGRVGRVEPAAEFVRQIVTEAKAVLAKLTALRDE